MPYDQVTAARIEKILSSWRHVDSRRMFGGICYLLRGNMFCGVYKDLLILRLGEKGAHEALRSPHARSMDITGRPMKGWVMVEGRGFDNEDTLSAWLEEARDFAESLPPKETRA